MTAIGTGYASGDRIEAAYVNRLGLALAGIGITDDNTGNPIVARSFANPLAIPFGDANVQSKAVDGASYTVPAGLVFVVTVLDILTNNIVVTPSGGGAITIATGGAQQNTAKVHIPLGAGDEIACGASTRAAGYLVTAQADAVPFLDDVTNAAPYTVPANKLALITHVGMGASATAVNGQVFVLNGVNAFETRGPVGDNGSASDFNDCRHQLLAKAGETLAAGGATAIIVAGYLLQ